ncbi:hypothetical protein Vadar_012021 [Vaccinium darrowii]|uniref:Uncharacterized protein n=1 Tax=Vaccinium darrowii TaxID=229202 RepID=A0ACB7YL70_9ERIC|nr:hypothetical protein Vadar_012021 [Vaccinium darrowii]
MEGVVGFEGEVDEDGLRNEQVCFSKLTSLSLSSLPKLVSFCTEMGEAGTTEGNPTIHAQPLFNGKVAFPAVEDLTISEVPMIKEIWVQQPLSKLEKEVESFCKLKSIRVGGCDQLEYVLPSYMLPQLHNLLDLEIRDCKELEVIVSNKLKEKEATNNDILVFPQLNTLELYGLDNLKCFCSGTDQLLFSHKVAFLALEHLTLIGVPMIKEIWVQQPLSKLEKEVESFCKLKSIRVGGCDQLEYVLPSYMLPQLHNLLDLEIRDCKELEVIVSNKLKEKEATNNDILVFPQLNTLELYGLDNLKCFCSGTDQLLFSHKVAFPAVEDLTISEVPMIKEIWVQQPLSKLEKEVESFCKLKSIRVWGCDQLEYVLPSYMLPQLHNLLDLEIRDCKELEVIVSNKLKEKEATNNDILVFPQLNTLELYGLDNLKCFCSGTDQLLFSHKVAFPALEHLQIWNTPSITEIWDKKPLSEPEQEIESFSKLVTIDVYRCDQLVYVLPSYMLSHLQDLQKLEIENCEEVEVIVSKELKEKEATDNDPIVFSQLKKVKCSSLPKLKSFYTGTQLFFSNKVTFPRLENLELDGCGSLRCIFQLSMARVLVNLQQLIIQDCSKMEAVVDGEEEIEDGQGRKSTDKTLFPHLSKLELRRLLELRWFCHFRYPLELPLLSKMVIEFCPKLNSFSSGSVSSSAHAQMALFNDKVILPGLEDLLVLALDRIEEIWDKQSPLVNQETMSFGQLKIMTVKSCGKLTNLFPSTILPRLQNLQTLLVDGCPNVEFVVFKNEKGEEQVADDDSTLIIPQLTHLQILDMEKLKSFYSSTTTSNAESLFNHQVTCPRLENLELEECKSLRCIFQPSMASVLVDLQELIINDCSKMEAVFDREEEIEDGQGRNSIDKTLLPHLRKLELRCLPRLRRFCHFRYPVELPLLSRMVILGCPKMNSFSLGQVSTPNLALQGISPILKVSEKAREMEFQTIMSQLNDVLVTVQLIYIDEINTAHVQLTLTNS